MRCLHGFVFTFFLLQSAFSQSLNASLTDISNSFSSAGLVPDVIPVFRPSGLLTVQYAMAGETFDIMIDETLPTALTDSTPSFELTVNATQFNSTGPFVLVMIDTNSAGTSEDKGSDAQPVLYLLQADMTYTSSDSKLASTSKPLESYSKPDPPSSDDPHRFVVLLYNQPSNFTEAAANSTIERDSFSLTNFVSDVIRGQPIAGNFFKVEPTDGDSSTRTTGKATATTPPKTSFTAANIPSLTPLISDYGHKNTIGMVPILGACIMASLLLV